MKNGKVNIWTSCHSEVAQADKGYIYIYIFVYINIRMCKNIHICHMHIHLYVFTWVSSSTSGTASLQVLLPALREASNRLSEVRDLFRRSTESSDSWYTSRQLKQTIRPQPEGKSAPRNDVSRQLTRRCRAEGEHFDWP